MLRSALSNGLDLVVKGQNSIHLYWISKLLENPLKQHLSIQTTTLGESSCDLSLKSTAFQYPHLHIGKAHTCRGSPRHTDRNKLVCSASDSLLVVEEK